MTITHRADDFWAQVRQQLAELRHARNADDVLTILAVDRNPHGDPTITTADGFFAGTGGDDTVLDALLDAGWRLTGGLASYHYAMTAPDGSSITYVEGDIYRGNLLSRRR